MTVFSELKTPCLLLDQQKLQRNLHTMSEHVRALGCNLRPHVKSSKCIEVVRQAQSPGAGGLTVSTLKEAEYFFAAGYNDILYAVGIAPSKLDAVCALLAQGCHLMVITDNLVAAQAIFDHSVKHQVTIPTLIEIDSDGHRAGIKPLDPLLQAVGRTLGPNLRGIMTHAGGSYDCENIAAIEHYAKMERDEALLSAEQLRRAGLACPVVSIGSTPTITFVDHLQGITEVRVGVYMFFDLFMTGLGVCNHHAIALSVLSTVIGHQTQKGWLLCDAGWMAMSRDRGTASQPIDQGYGVVCNERGEPIEDLIVGKANQEHGIIFSRSTKSIDFGQFPVGSLLRILPNHACATAAAHPGYQLVKGETVLNEYWSRFSGW